MDHIQLTPEMRARVLKNVEQQAAKPSGKTRPASSLRRFGALAACLAVLLVGALALPKMISQPAQKEPETMIANGMVEVTSREDLSSAVGFPVKSAEFLPFSPQSIYYTSYWGDMAQIDYASGSDSACFRQSLGAEDNSGDWNEYPAQIEADLSGCTVTLKGETDCYTLAIWNDGTYSYSLSLSSGQTLDVWQAIVEGVQ